MDASFVLLFALPIAGLLTAIVVVARTPKDVSAHRFATHHPNAPHRPAGLHR